MSGLDNVYLRGGVEEFICSSCGMKSTAIRNLIGLHKAISLSLAFAKRRLSGGELRFLREQLGFSAEELASLVEYSEEYIRKIEAGSTSPKAPYEMFLRVAILRGEKAPEYDLRELSQRKKYKLQELQFINKNKDWKVAA